MRSRRKEDRGKTGDRETQGWKGNVGRKGIGTKETEKKER